MRFCYGPVWPQGLQWVGVWALRRLLFQQRFRIAKVGALLAIGAATSWLYVRQVSENLTPSWPTAARGASLPLNGDERSREPATIAMATARHATTQLHRLVLQVSTNDPAIMSLALNNATNVEQYYKELGQKVEIEVVAFGAGLHMLREDTSPMKDRIRSMTEKMPSVSFRACSNTRENMGKAETKTIPLVPQATLVKSGVVRLMELQEQGWTYVKP